MYILNYLHLKWTHWMKDWGIPSINVIKPHITYTCTSSLSGEKSIIHLLLNRPIWVNKWELVAALWGKMRAICGPWLSLWDFRAPIQCVVQVQVLGPPTLLCETLGFVGRKWWYSLVLSNLGGFGFSGQAYFKPTFFDWIFVGYMRIRQRSTSTKMFWFIISMMMDKESVSCRGVWSDMTMGVINLKPLEVPGGLDRAQELGQLMVAWGLNSYVSLERCCFHWLYL